MNKKVIIIIPCYNESKRLDIARISQYLLANNEIQFCFVNDGSTDSTLELLSSFEAQFPEKIHIISLTQNQGKAEATRQGLLYVCNELKEVQYTGFWDADLSTPLEEIIPFINVLENDHNLKMVMGCRLKRLGARVERKLFRHYIGRIFATCISLHLNLPTYDTQCGAKIFHVKTLAPLIEKPFKCAWFFDVEILKRMQRLYGRDAMLTSIYEFPLMQWIDVGDSKVKMHKALWQFFKLIFLT